MDQNIQKRKYELRDSIFSEPITNAVRPFLLEYVRLLTGAAKDLPEKDLLGFKGHGIAMDICGALAFQGANGVQHDDWMNETHEPIFAQLLDVSGKLDVDANDKEAWSRLFELIDRLKDE